MRRDVDKKTGIVLQCNWIEIRFIFHVGLLYFKYIAWTLVKF